MGSSLIAEKRLSRFRLANVLTVLGIGALISVLIGLIAMICYHEWKYPCVRWSHDLECYWMTHQVGDTYIPIQNCYHPCIERRTRGQDY